MEHKPHAQKIYTRKGDKGYTQVMGTRIKISKCNPRIEAIGSVDELNCWVGMIKHYSDDYDLTHIQNDLFSIGSSLADTKKYPNKDLTMKTLTIDILEQNMDLMSKNLDPLKNFILPGGNKAMCHCHIARTVCRRAERAIVQLAEIDSSIDGVIDPNILKYINRLSDYFFVLARHIAKNEGICETIWSANTTNK